MESCYQSVLTLVYFGVFCMVAHIYWRAMSYVVYSILIGDVSNVDFLLQVILAILRHDTVYSTIQTCGLKIIHIYAHTV